MSLKSTTVDEPSYTTSRSASQARDRNAGFDKDIELGEWYGQSQSRKQTPIVRESKAEKKARKAHEKEDRMPFVVRVVIGMITFALKAVVWVLTIIFKMVAGLLKMVVKSFNKS